MATSLNRRFSFGLQHLASQVFKKNTLHSSQNISTILSMKLSTLRTLSIPPSHTVTSGKRLPTSGWCRFNYSLRFAPQHGSINRKITRLGHHSPAILNLQHADCRSSPSLVQFRQNSSATVPGKPGNLPSLDVLRNVQMLMTDQVSKIFSDQHEYRIYTKDLVFQNNWDLNQPYTTVGVTAYALKVMKARIYLNFTYARLKVKILSTSIHEDLGCVCIRWQVGGLDQSKAFMFWQYAPFAFKKTADKQLKWLDGLSTFSVNKEGYIFKHCIDRVIPDRETSVEEEKKPGDVAPANA